MVRDSVEEQRANWPGRTLTLDLPAQAVLVRADADRLRQVATNYLTNALKYSPRDQPVAVTVRVAGDEAWVGVRDEGFGLTPAQQQEIWERYRRVESVVVADTTGRAGGNLGLGLYISRTIIAQHGGQVGVESAPGAGALFWFTLPLVPPA
jgi:signal transduction histidine kinase